MAIPFDNELLPTGQARSETKLSLRNVGSEWHNAGELFVSEWRNALRTITVRFGAKSAQAARDVLEFWHSRDAQRAFRARDWSDWTTDISHSRKPTAVPNSPGYILADQQNLHVIGCGNGQNGQVLQLRKWYRSGDYERSRPILRPTRAGDPDDLQLIFARPPQVPMFLQQLPLGSGALLDRLTGKLTLTGGVPNGWEIVWAGTFDVPVIFDPTTDPTNFQRVELAGKVQEVGSVTLAEVPDDDVDEPEWRQSCGVTDDQFASNYQLSLHGVLKVIRPEAAGLNVYLPSYDGVATGGPFAWVVNAGTHTCTLRTFAGTAVVTALQPGQAVELCMRADRSIAAF